MEWRSMPEIDGYEVSNAGQVRIFGKDIIPGINEGYQYIYKDKKRLYIHRLVLTAFIGPCPCGNECRHLDGNKLNNHINNLKWGSRKDNVHDSIKHGTHNGLKPRNGSKNNAAKLTESQVLEIRKLIPYNTLASIALKYSVSLSAIWLIKKGKKWTHI